MNSHDKLTTSHEIAKKIEETLIRGQEYVEAILLLADSLSVVKPDDLAVGFDVGSGADIVAFKKLGFERAIATNDQSSAYSFSFQKTAELENARLTTIVREHAPKITRLSSLSVFDWLEVESFSPRLVTMLRMAPSWFGEDGDPAIYLKELLDLSNKIDEDGVVILSALDDHPLSENAFRTLAKLLDDEETNNQLMIDDDISPELRILGQRILVFGKRKS